MCAPIIDLPSYITTMGDGMNTEHAQMEKDMVVGFRMIYTVDAGRAISICIFVTDLLIRQRLLTRPVH